MDFCQVTLKVAKPQVEAFVQYATKHNGTVVSHSKRLFASNVCICFENEKDLKIFSKDLEKTFGTSVTIKE